jgi:hypothetical protein
MIRHTVSFLAGTAAMAAVTYSAGGATMRAGFIVGLSLSLAILATWPRQAARALVGFAEGLAAFHAHWLISQPVAPASKRSPSPLAKPGDAVPARKTPREMPALTAVQSDVESALVNLGMARGKARLVAVQTSGEDFESAFREAQAAAV